MTQPEILQIDALEKRQMLSTVQVFAAGSMGDEAFELQVNGETVLEVADINGGGEFTVDVAEDVTADDVRILFTNDAWDPANGVDRNLIVDKIVIDGNEFQTEAPSTVSTGTWNGSGFSEGTYESEWLHADGYFQFADADVDGTGDSNTGDNSQGSTLMQVRARGEEGGENLRLLVNGQEVASIDVTTEWQVYDIYTDVYGAGAEVRVEFTNDLWDPQAGIDCNLYVDYVAVNGEVCETEDPTTFGYGTWNNGFSEGYHQSEELHTNGYFIYKFKPTPEPTASLGDKVFFDSNRNGIQDADESGVGGVKVTLTGGGADGTIGTSDDTMAMMNTDINGMYRFDGLTPGEEYKVTFSELPTGFEFTAANVGDDTRDSDADPNTGMTQIVTLTPGENNPTLDAGIVEIEVDTAPVCIHEQEIVVADAYNRGRGQTVVVDLSKGVEDADGDDLTYKLDFDDEFFVEGKRKGKFGWEVLDFDEDTGMLEMQVFTEDEEAWHYDGAEVSSLFVEATEDKDGANGLRRGTAFQDFGFTVHDEDGNSLECSFGLQVFDTHYSSPIALDLNGDSEIGVTGEHTAQSSVRNSIGETVQFDIDADGSVDTIEWFAGDGDGILVNTADIRAGGTIDGSALFGDQGGAYANGYEKLARLDANADGQVAGSELAGLALWIDDGDARLEFGELNSLDQYQITSISVDMKLDGEGRMRSTARTGGWIWSFDRRRLVRSRKLTRSIERTLIADSKNGAAIGISHGSSFFATTCVCRTRTELLLGA